MRGLTFLFQLLIAGALIGGSAFWIIKNAGRPGGVPVEDAGEFRDWVGKPAAIQFTAVDGTEVNLAEPKGRVVLVYFWASWCGACSSVLTDLRTAYTKYHDQGFDIVGINLDEDRSQLDAYVRDKNIRWPQCHDAARGEKGFGPSYRITSIPTIWLLGKTGLIRFVDGRRDLDAKIAFLLGGEKTESDEKSESAPATETKSTGGSGYANVFDKLKKAVTKAANSERHAESGAAQFTEKTSTNAAPPAAFAREEATSSAKEGEKPSAEKPSAKKEEKVSPAKKAEIARLNAEAEKVLDLISLKGVTLSTTRSSAMLKLGRVNRTISQGEEIVVRTTDGPVVFRCEEIRAGAIVMVLPKTDLRREIHLRQVSAPAEGISLK